MNPGLSLLIVRSSFVVKNLRHIVFSDNTVAGGKDTIYENGERSGPGYVAGRDSQRHPQFPSGRQHRFHHPGRHVLSARQLALLGLERLLMCHCLPASSAACGFSDTQHIKLIQARPTSRPWHTTHHDRRAGPPAEGSRRSKQQLSRAIPASINRATERLHGVR